MPLAVAWSATFTTTLALTLAVALARTRTTRRSANDGLRRTVAVVAVNTVAAVVILIVARTCISTRIAWLLVTTHCCGGMCARLAITTTFRTRSTRGLTILVATRRLTIGTTCLRLAAARFTTTSVSGSSTAVSTTCFTLRTATFAATTFTLATTTLALTTTTLRLLRCRRFCRHGLRLWQCGNLIGRTLDLEFDKTFDVT